MTDKLLQAIREKVNPEELIDILGYTTDDLLDMSEIRFKLELEPERFDYLEVDND